MPWYKQLWRGIKATIFNSVLISMFLAALITIVLSFFLLDDAIGIGNILSAEESNKLSKLGSAGDYFGGFLNPIISFIALTALLFTIRQNNIALEATQDELAASREEMARSAQALERQVEINRRNDAKQDCYTAINASFDSLNQHLAETHDIGMYYETLLFMLDKKYFTNETVVRQYKHTIDEKIIAPALTHISLLNELRHLDPDSSFLRFQVERIRPFLNHLKENELLERDESRALKRFFNHYAPRYFVRKDKLCY